MPIRVHAICLALNEEPFIEELLKTLYPFCSGISVLTQYDRDYHSNRVQPDQTACKVLNFPDPDGKIHFVVRRWRDQAPALNSEMLALSSRPARRVQQAGAPLAETRVFHTPPDYFLIVDADEIYDIDTFGNILTYLEQYRPRGMRVVGYNYVRTWNRRVPRNVVYFCQFGFVRPGVLFKHRRYVGWNESRLSKLLRRLRLPDFSARVFGFITCPEEVGVFHHGSWLGNDERLKAKLTKNTYPVKKGPPGYWSPEAYVQRIDATATIFVPRSTLPRNIREGNWPESFFED